MFLYIQWNLYKTGHSHRVMRDYAINTNKNSVGTKKSICIIFLRAIIIYDTFIFHVNNLGILNFIKYYVMLMSMINTTSTLTLVYGK